MAEVQYITHNDNHILLIDFVGISDYRVVPSLIEKAVHLAQSSEGSRSIRTLIDLSGTRINRQIISSFRTLSRNNGRYAKATAFSGLGNSWSTLLSLIFRASRKRNHKVLPSRSQALQWLDQW
jgi:hypothetical protein